MLTPIWLAILIGQSNGEHYDSGTLKRIVSANAVEVVFSNFHVPNGPVPVKEKIVFMGTSSPAPGKPGFQQALSWAKTYFRLGAQASGNVYKTPTGYLGQVYLATTGKGSGMEGGYDAILNGMAAFDEKAVPTTVKKASAYKQWRRIMVEAETEAKKGRKGLWATVWKAKR